MTGICDVITAYKLTDVLSKATRLKRMQHVLVDGCQGETPPDGPGKVCHGTVSLVQSLEGISFCIFISSTFNNVSEVIFVCPPCALTMTPVQTWVTVTCRQMALDMLSCALLCLLRLMCLCDP